MFSFQQILLNIKIDPNNLAAHLNLALTLIEQGEIQQAIDCYKKLSEINNPTLIVVGLADATTPPALSYELKAGISGSILQELPQIGHCPQLQDPTAFLNAVVPFLNS